MISTFHSTEKLYNMCYYFYTKKLAMVTTTGFTGKPPTSNVICQRTTIL